MVPDHRSAWIGDVGDADRSDRDRRVRGLVRGPLGGRTGSSGLHHRAAGGARRNVAHPYASAIKGATFALRELRTQAEGDPLRTLYAFDPSRQAVLLIGGDKTGDDRFYDRMIPIAERIWNEYLEETAQKKPRKK
jgi:hypothetical protein